MKEASKERLYADLLKNSEQLGILPEQTPMLILDRKEYHALKVSNGMSKHAGGYGECNLRLLSLKTLASEAIGTIHIVD